MRTIELTDEEHDILTRLAYDGTLDPPGPRASQAVSAANTLCLRMRNHLEDAEETANVELVHKLYELFPELKGFDTDTEERCLFKESLEALQRHLPQSLKQEPLVLGTLLLRIQGNPNAAGYVVLEAFDTGGRMAIR